MFPREHFILSCRLWYRTVSYSFVQIDLFLFNIEILFILVKRAIGEKDSKRIIHFNKIRERFLALEIPAKRQAHLMRLELSSAIKTPEKTLHLINLILMLFSHCQPGFSGALTEPESIEELLACFVLCKTRSNVAIKLAWLIKVVVFILKALFF